MSAGIAARASAAPSTATPNSWSVPITAGPTGSTARCARIAALNARMVERSAALGIAIAEHHHWDPSAGGEEAVIGFRYALYDGVATGSADGRAVAPLMGRFRDYDGGATSVHLGPASFL